MKQILFIAIVLSVVGCKKNINLSSEGCDLITTKNDTLYLVESDSVPYLEGITFVLGNASWNYDHYNWNTGENTSSIAVKDSGFYSVKAYNNQNQIIDSATYLINYYAGYVLTPNSFTPDGDGINELWYPRLNNVCENSYTLMIYNEYNEAVFEVHNVNQKWDGTYQAGVAPQGQYTFQLIILNIKGETITREGVINLLR